MFEYNNIYLLFISKIVDLSLVGLVREPYTYTLVLLVIRKKPIRIPKFLSKVEILAGGVSYLLSARTEKHAKNSRIIIS